MFGCWPNCLASLLTMQAASCASQHTAQVVKDVIRLFLLLHKHATAELTHKNKPVKQIHTWKWPWKPCLHICTATYMWLVVVCKLVHWMCQVRLTRLCIVLWEVSVRDTNCKSGQEISLHKVSGLPNVVIIRSLEAVIKLPVACHCTSRAWWTIFVCCCMCNGKLKRHSNFWGPSTPSLWYPIQFQCDRFWCKHRVTISCETRCMPAEYSCILNAPQPRVGLCLARPRQSHNQVRGRGTAVL